MSYAFVHEGKAFGPSGIIKDVEGTPLEAKDVGEYNKAVEAQELEWLKTAPEKVMLYVKMPEAYQSPLNGVMSKTQPLTGTRVQTWLGTDVATNVIIGFKVRSGFGYGSYRRSVSCKIFGIQYYGWFYESSRDYCRLRRAKVQ